MFDPRHPNIVVVVGRTVQPLQARCRDYIRTKTKTTPSILWAQALMQQGIRPAIRLIQTCNADQWVTREQYWIAYWKKKNPCLLNVHKGGNGGLGGLSPKLHCEKHNHPRTQTPSGRWRCILCWREQKKRAYWRNPEQYREIDRRFYWNHLETRRPSRAKRQQA